MAFTSIFAQSFLTSAAMAKVVNTATNLGALIVFIIGGHVWWTLGIVLAVANIAGAQLGARTVLGGGQVDSLRAAHPGRGYELLPRLAAVGLATSGSWCAR